MTIELRITDEPDDGGEWLLYYVDDQGVTHACGYIYADEVETVQKALAAVSGQGEERS